MDRRNYRRYRKGGPMNVSDNQRHENDGGWGNFGQEQQRVEDNHSQPQWQRRPRGRDGRRGRGQNFRRGDDRQEFNQRGNQGGADFHQQGNDSENYRGRGRGRGRGNSQNDRRGPRNFRNSGQNRASQEQQIKFAQGKQLSTLPLKRMQLEPSQLPIYFKQREILQHIEQYGVIVIQGSTGCGKSTQVPQMIHRRWPDKRIAITEPRRLVVTGLAKRVTQELGGEMGSQIVGYQMMGEKCYTPQSKIVFMVTEILTQQLCKNKYKYKRIPWDVVILDEVHERTVELDLLMAILKHIKRKYDIYLVLMSATINVDIIANYFNQEEIEFADLNRLDQTYQFDQFGDQNEEPMDLNQIWQQRAQLDVFPFQTPIHQQASPYEQHRADHAPQIMLDASNFEVRVVYLEDIQVSLESRLIQDDYLPEYAPNEVFKNVNYFRPDMVPDFMYHYAAKIIKYTHMGQLTDEEGFMGTFLVFLPGIQEINMMDDILKQNIADFHHEFEIVLLHSSLPENLHVQVLNPPKDKRRVVLSTNIAESSITLPDVRYIIDFGFAKEIVFNSSTMTERLQLSWAAQSTMEQRRGRAGRVAEGVCYRLMPINFYNTMLYHFPKPEMLHSPLDKLILRVMLLNFCDPRALLERTLQPPEQAEVARTQLQLYQMGAIDNRGITQVGRLYADLPVDIKLARLCIMGYLHQEPEACVMIAALLAQCRNPIQNLSNLDINLAQKHPDTYKVRLKFDKGARSDPICLLNIFLEWYFLFPDDVKQFVESSRSNQQVKYSKECRDWCRQNYLDKTFLRDALVMYVNLKQRLAKYKGLKIENDFPDDFEDLRGYDDDDERPLAIKLCIAGAFVGRYLNTTYSMDDEYMRQQIIKKIGDESTFAFSIPCIPDIATSDDIKNLFANLCEEEPEVSITHGTALVKFPEDEFDDLQLALWMSYSNTRFKTGKYLIIKKVVRDQYKNVVKVVPLEDEKERNN